MTSIANAAIFEEMVGQCERVKQKNIYRAQHDRENPYRLGSLINNADSPPFIAKSFSSAIFDSTARRVMA